MEESGPGHRVLEPSAQQWAAVPLRTPAKPIRLVAWFIALLTTAAAFVLDRGWEGLTDETVPAWEGPYRLMDMFGLAGIGLAIVFALAGWATGRFAVLLSPAVLLAAAIPHTLDGYLVAPVWWLGCAVALVWLGYTVFDSTRQLRAVHRLAANCATGKVLRVSKEAQRLLVRAALRDWLWALGLGLAGVVAWVWTFRAFAKDKGKSWEQVGGSMFSDLSGVRQGQGEKLGAGRWFNVLGPFGQCGPCAFRGGLGPGCQLSAQGLEQVASGSHGMEAALSTWSGAGPWFVQRPRCSDGPGRRRR